MSTEPNWGEINRVISESIEPKPTMECIVTGMLSDKRGWSYVHVRSTDAWTYFMNHGGQRPEDPGWQPRDWREPAAAMELLKRLKHYDAMSVLIETQDSRDKLEEAIALAFYATVKDKI